MTNWSSGQVEAWRESCTRHSCSTTSSSQTQGTMRRCTSIVAVGLLVLGCGSTDPSDYESTDNTSAGPSGPASDALEPFTVPVPWGTGMVSFEVPITAAGVGGGTLRFVGALQHAKIQGEGTSFRLVPLDDWTGTDSIQLELAVASREPQRVWVRVEAAGPTRGDTTVTVVRSARPLTSIERHRYLPGGVDDPRLDGVRPLVRSILLEYGSPESDFDRARALRDWVARTAVHPYVPFHPDGSIANLAALPPGITWSDFNSSIASRETQDNAFWLFRHYNGYAMLDTLLGTYNSGTGNRNDDGILRHVGGARYQMRSLETFRSVYCSYQGVMLRTLLLAEGLHGMGMMLTDHEATAVFLPSLGKWVYMDPTFNESFFLGNGPDPLSPLELFELRRNGAQGTASRRRGVVPNWDDIRYISRLNDPRATYFGNNPLGMPILGVVLNSRDAEKKDQWGGYYDQRLAMVDTPEVDQYWPFSRRDAYARLQPEEAFPDLGVRVSIARPTMDSVLVTIVTNQPDGVVLQRKLNGGQWQNVGASDRLSLRTVPMQSILRYRSLDVRSHPSAVAEIRLRDGSATE